MVIFINLLKINKLYNFQANCVHRVVQQGGKGALNHESISRIDCRGISACLPLLVKVNRTIIKQMDNEETTEKTLWHQILGRIFKFLLPPLGISVSTDVKVMIKPPEADILLLKRKDQNWTDEQLKRLPDGIRDSQASHILIEFKATQSLSKESFIQAAAYEYFYKQSNKLTDDEIQTFVISAIQPQKANRAQYGYKIQVQPGVYKSDLIAFNHITLISLNELPNKLHNAWVTCLASKKLKRLEAFKLLQSKGFKFIPKPFKWFLVDLWRRISEKGDDDMALDLSPQEIKDIGKMWGSSLFTPEDFKEYFDSLPLKGQRTFFSNMPLEERLIGLKPEEQLIGLKPKERVKGLKLEDRLDGLSAEEIEDYLKTLKKKS